MSGLQIGTMTVQDILFTVTTGKSETSVDVIVVSLYVERRLASTHIAIFSIKPPRLFC